jgi:hypothetical protein
MSPNLWPSVAHYLTRWRYFLALVQDSSRWPA